MTFTSNENSAQRIERINQCIRRDPSRRGLFRNDAVNDSLLRDELSCAAHDVAQRGRHVAIVTGFFVPNATPDAAETDGPPGAVLLADILNRMGSSASILTDSFCGSAVVAASAAAGLARNAVIEIDDDSDHRLRSMLDGLNDAGLTHLIAVERVGPSHTADSITRQYGESSEFVEQFRIRVADEHRDRSHNMRGECIDRVTARLHRLFELCEQSSPDCRTIGIGDGGNEIGMGSVAWHELVDRIESPVSERFVCRIPADWTIPAGTSNWGAWALAASIAVLRGCGDLLGEWTDKRHEQVLNRMVRDGPAVDGITRRQESTVDGLPFETYLGVWREIVQAASVETR